MGTFHGFLKIGLRITFWPNRSTPRNSCERLLLARHNINIYLPQIRNWWQTKIMSYIEAQLGKAESWSGLFTGVWVRSYLQEQGWLTGSCIIRKPTPLWADSHSCNPGALCKTCRQLRPPLGQGTSSRDCVGRWLLWLFQEPVTLVGFSFPEQEKRVYFLRLKCLPLEWIVSA